MIRPFLIGLLVCAGGRAALTPAQIADNQARALRNRAVTQVGVLRQLRTAAEAGDSLAQYYLGTLLDAHHNLESSLIQQDASAAAQWYRKSSAQGNADAAFSLGALYATGDGVSQDLAEAARLAAQAADAGRPAAQLAAAQLYSGCKLPADPARTSAWLAKAAEQGDPGALVKLVLTSKDYARSAHLLRRPTHLPSRVEIELGSVADFYVLAMRSAEICTVPPSTQELLAPILADAHGKDFALPPVAGNTDAAYVAGRILIRIGAGPESPKNGQDGLAWLTASAARGNPNAAFTLGEHYRDMTGANRDRVKAADYFRQAALKQDAPAAFALGGLYNTGIRADVDPPDYAQAVKWLRAAADLGYAPAQTELGIHYESGYGVPKDPAQAARWYRKALAQNDAEAADYLGKLYQNGSGVSRDPVEAGRLFGVALELGNDGAGCDLAWLYLHGLAAPEAGGDPRIDAYKWYDIVFNRCRNRDGCPSGAANSGMQAAGKSLNPAQIEEARKLAVAWLDAHGDN